MTRSTYGILHVKSHKAEGNIEHNQHYPEKPSIIYLNSDLIVDFLSLYIFWKPNSKMKWFFFKAPYVRCRLSHNITLTNTFFLNFKWKIQFWYQYLVDPFLYCKRFSCIRVLFNLLVCHFSTLYTFSVIFVSIVYSFPKRYSLFNSIDFWKKKGFFKLLFKALIKSQNRSWTHILY